MLRPTFGQAFGVAVANRFAVHAFPHGRRAVAHKAAPVGYTNQSAPRIVHSEASFRISDRGSSRRSSSSSFSSTDLLLSSWDLCGSNSGSDSVGFRVRFVCILETKVFVHTQCFCTFPRRCFSLHLGSLNVEGSLRESPRSLLQIVHYLFPSIFVSSIVSCRRRLESISFSFVC